MILANHFPRRCRCPQCSLQDWFWRSEICQLYRTTGLPTKSDLVTGWISADWLSKVFYVVCRRLHRCVVPLVTGALREVCNWMRRRLRWCGSGHMWLWGRVQLTTCGYDLAVMSLHWWMSCATSGLHSILSWHWQCNCTSTKSAVSAFITFVVSASVFILYIVLSIHYFILN